MEQILKDINAIVGVMGSFVCNGEGQVLAQAMPGLFDKGMLSPVGRTMAQTIAGLKIARRRKVGDIDLLFDQGRLIVKGVGEGCLCILCVRRINVPLLNLTANLAVKKLEEKMRKAGTQVTVWKPEPQPERQLEPEPAPEIEMESQAEDQAEDQAENQVEDRAEPKAEAQPPRRLSLAEIMAANIRR